VCLSVQQCLVKFVGAARLAQLLAQILPPHQPGDPTQNFDVLAGSGLRTYDEKKEPDWLTIYRVVRYRTGADTTDESQLADGGGPSVWNGDAESDPRAKNGFPLLHSAEDFGEGSSRALYQMASQLGDDAGLIACRQRDHDPVWCEQLGQEHGVTWVGMESNLYHAM
jgi:hypothetical protein